MVSRRYIEDLAEQQFEGRMREAILEAIERLRNDMDLDAIAEAIAAGDVDEVVSLTGIDTDDFDEVLAVNAAALATAGRQTADVVPPARRNGQRVRFEFRPGNPRAERKVRDLQTELMRGLNGGPGISSEGAEAVREHVRDGLRRGANPRDTARRMRGIIGLTDRQAKIVRRAEDQLRSGNPDDLRKYLGRKLRDKRFDRTVMNAIDTGEPIPEEKVERMVERYRAGWRRNRAETVARDQTLSALSRGQEEALDQAVESGFTKERNIVREWVTARDSRVRDAHQAIPGMNRGGRKRGEPFRTPLGDLQHPRDPGGSAENTINCRCTLVPRVIKDNGED